MKMLSCIATAIFAVGLSIVQAQETKFAWKITVSRDAIDDGPVVEATLNTTQAFAPGFGLRCARKTVIVFTTISNAGLPGRALLRGRLRVNDGPIRDGEWTAEASAASPLLQWVVATVSRTSYGRIQEARKIAIRLIDENGGREWTNVFDIANPEALAPLYNECPLEQAPDTPPRPPKGEPSK